ncbi:LysR family transcriptional regulator [Nocardia farcinica]|uniref:Putative transcriptional regulator n=1 Tax=Nocardia farcinica (strain IFM 10152) TaxID=247156 RepID=Q5YYD1_NOCFA|nr:LysR family transcriptional regulator [Nocardia farcinica]BAD56810.1 putative transcriptional regulator [Nocardia farcinica IFM 10152]
MDLQVRHLAAFVALCDTGTYTRAAARLHLTQPSLTRTIQDLERILDCDLVIRGGRGLELTAEGAEFLPRARRILTDLTELHDDMRGRAVVRLGFAWLLPSDWFAATRARYEALGGTLAIHRVDDPAGALEHGRIDVALARTVHRESAAITWRRIGTERRVLAVSTHSALARRPGLSWADLAAHPLVVNIRSGTTTPSDWPDPRTDREIVTCTNFDEWLELVAADRGIGAVPDIAVERAPHPGVVYRDLPDIPDSPLFLGWRSTPPPARSTRRYLDVALDTG